jgi:hypothetical protein
VLLFKEEKKKGKIKGRKSNFVVGVGRDVTR